MRIVDCFPGGGESTSYYANNGRALGMRTNLHYAGTRRIPVCSCPKASQLQSGDANQLFTLPIPQLLLAIYHSLHLHWRSGPTRIAAFLSITVVCCNPCLPGVFVYCVKTAVPCTQRNFQVTRRSGRRFNRSAPASPVSHATTLALNRIFNSLVIAQIYAEYP